MHSQESKRKFVELVKLIVKFNQSKESGAKEISRSFGIPLKSLKRWILIGTERKKGKTLFKINAVEES